MPLYMDIHKVETDAFTVEDVVKAHMKDLAVQAKFGVVQIKYWVNVDSQLIFCLMEGPSKEACNQVHVESHGNTACNIIEVSDDEYNIYLSMGKSVKDLAHKENGAIDAGFRTMIMTSLVDLAGNYKYLEDEIKNIINNHNGTIVIHPDEEIIASFVYASDAVLCAVSINNILKPIQDNLEFVITVVSGNPLDKQTKNLFEETKSKANYLTAVGLKKIMFIDVETKILSSKEPMSPNIRDTEFKTINDSDVEFLFNLFRVFKQKLNDPEFNSSQLYGLLGLSKSQAYRKIKSLTKITPNQLIQELRLKKALKEIKKKNTTISEISYELGFNSPAYFARLFKKRFSLTPSAFSKISHN